jgi:zinc protease
MNLVSTVLVFFFLISSSDIYAQRAVERLDWDGLEVIYIADDRLPTYSLAVYFADGALADTKGREGETSAALNLLNSGTRRFDNSTIAENLEFFGASTSAMITHEFATFTVSGLVKDIVPTMKLVCHLFEDSIYPKPIIDRELNRAIEGLSTMVSQHGALAARAHRELSLKGTPYSLPSDGKIASLKRLTPVHLKDRLTYLNTKVKKRIYLTGPKQVLSVQRIVAEECGWSNQSDLFVRRMNPSLQEKKTSPIFHLVPVKEANQAQVRMGSYLTRDQITRRDVMTTLSHFLGSGFTSLLLNELRVKRGLTYSAGALASGQRDYGRTLISTSTANDNLGTLLSVIKETLERLQSQQVEENSFLLARQGLAGSYPFKFESSRNYLMEVLIMDHDERDLSELYSFQRKIEKVDLADVSELSKSLFDWNQMTFLIVGDKGLEETLKQFGTVVIVPATTVL